MYYRDIFSGWVDLAYNTPHLENHHLLLEMLTVKQHFKIQSSIVNTNNRLNRVFNSFDSFNNELSPRKKLIYLYSSCFSFHHLDRKSSNTRKTYLCHLNEIVFNMSSDSKIAVIISDTSIKNQVSTSIYCSCTHSWFPCCQNHLPCCKCHLHWSRTICHQVWIELSYLANQYQTYHHHHWHNTCH